MGPSLHLLDQFVSMHLEISVLPLVVKSVVTHNASGVILASHNLSPLIVMKIFEYFFLTTRTIARRLNVVVKLLIRVC